MQTVRTVVASSIALAILSMAVTSHRAMAATPKSAEQKPVATKGTPMQFSETIYVGKSAHDVWEGITDEKIVSRYFMAPLV